MIRKTMKQILAKPVAMPAIPPKPKTAEIKAIIRKVIAAESIIPPN
jgi:hypothetical protein